jgi:hypothetical protein
MLGQADFIRADVVSVGTEQLQSSHLLLGIGLDPQLEFGHSAVSPVTNQRSRRVAPGSRQTRTPRAGCGQCNGVIVSPLDTATHWTILLEFSSWR